MKRQYTLLFSTVLATVIIVLGSFQTAIEQYYKIVLLSGAVHSQDLVNLMERFQFLSNANLVIDASGLHVLISTLCMLKEAVSNLNK